jgi:bis(5'-nucleosidyl)-tetraphosphatase
MPAPPRSRRNAPAERSAGVIVFRHDPPGTRLYLLLDYGKYWEYAKGHVEPGEDDPAAALRELHEETGIDDVDLLPGFAHEITYFFRDKNKRLVRKTVVFFTGRTHRQRIQISHEHDSGEFLPFDQALSRLKYPTSKQVLRLAEEFLNHSDRQNVA